MVIMRRFALLGVSLVACTSGEVDSSDVKMVGVGLNPDEIGQTAELAGGLFEYDWINFAGDQLPLALLGFTSYDIASYTSGFKPPYAWVSGLSFIFSDDTQSPDSIYGNFASPPGVDGGCQMVVEPFSYLTSSSADVGDAVQLRGTKEKNGAALDVTVGRYPAVYPADPQDVFPYYQYNSSWRDAPSYTYVQTKAGSQSPYDLERQILEAPNFIHGSSMELAFPGSLPPIEANNASIPVPLGTVGDLPMVELPDRQDGIMLSWNGPRYDRYGSIVGEGEQTTCFRYRADEKAPASAEDCVGLDDPASNENELVANMYTGPWDTDDGVKFSWVPVDGSDDTVTITVRFLGPIDLTDPNLVSAYVPVTPTAAALEEFKAAEGAGVIPEGAEPVGYRAALPCDDPNDIEWTVDPNLLMADGGYTAALQGNPTDTMIELTCQVADSDGEFVLTQDIVQEALDYAELHNAQGTVFYFSRSQKSTFPTPDVRDRYGKRHEISDIEFVSNSIELGRFWYAL
jgi:hypothetical protein